MRPGCTTFATPAKSSELGLSLLDLKANALARSIRKSSGFIFLGCSSPEKPVS